MARRSTPFWVTSSFLLWHATSNGCLQALAHTRFSCLCLLAPDDACPHLGTTLASVDVSDTLPRTHVSSETHVEHFCISTNINALTHWASQRSLHNAPIFRLLLKVAVNGTHQCDFLNFCGGSGSQCSLCDHSCLICKIILACVRALARNAHVCDLMSCKGCNEEPRGQRSA